MLIARFADPVGDQWIGIPTAGRDGVVAIAPVGADDDSLVLGLIAGDASAHELVRGRTSAQAPVHDLDTVRFLPPIARPSKYLAVSDNYSEHVREVTGTGIQERGHPKLFLKPPSTIVGNDSVVSLPEIGEHVDWEEIELAVVIGRRGRGIPLDTALEHVGGYSITVDVSARQMAWGVAREESPWNEFFDWLNGKWFDGFGPLGPWLATTDEVPDPQALDLQLWVNDELRQSASTREMNFGVAELVSWASRIMTLEPGDLIATGTPAGVGYASGRFLADGDVVTGSISSIGTLRFSIGDSR